jgi:LysR family transcriptional regulator, low CO2-responsive transcriptional regulator
MSRATTRRFFRHGLLPQLFVFEAVARLGSVTRAAEELHLAQPTVSMQLKKLAETMDVTLLEPQGRQLRLTGAGHALREICEELIHCLARADARLEAFRKPKGTRLHLAAEPEVRAVASRLLGAFCARHPGVQASLHVGERAALLTRLAAGTDDVYLFALDVEGLPVERRWSLAHPNGRAPSPTAALFLQEALVLDGPGAGANNAPAIEEIDEWSSRATTTRR